RRATHTAVGPLRKARDMKHGSALLLIAIAAGALALVPILAPPFYANLLVPFYGYAIALLGFNLLFGYTGLLSFGHALFLGLGAYTAAVLAGLWGIKEFEVVLLAAALAGLILALPLGWLAVRYKGIFFGMLTLAYGMLAHAVLFKFYHLTGGGSGMRGAPLPLLGLEVRAFHKIGTLGGPPFLLFFSLCAAPPPFLLLA